MNDRAVSLFANYNLDVEKTRKGRGMLIAQTSQGMFELVQFQGSLQHLVLEYGLLESMKDRFFHPVDRIIKTKDENLFCSDFEGKKYILKNYMEGRECNVFCPEELLSAMQSLALLHLAMRNEEIPIYEESKEAIYAQMTWENMQKSQEEAAGKEKRDTDLSIQEQRQNETDMDECAPEEKYKISQYDKTDDILDEFLRRNKELSRVRNYIRKKSKRDDFELHFLKVYDLYFEQTRKAQDFLTSEELAYLKDSQITSKMYAHGDCTQHNGLVTREGITFINFEKCGAHLQLKDVYMFLRKVLEKNNWSVELGKRMVEAYQQILPLGSAEMKYLMACFIYPEKFWKIANTYLNRRKSLLTGRQMEKLLAYEEKEEARQEFIKKLLTDAG